MEKVSILDQIISSQKAEEAAKLDAVEIINNLFSELTPRERDIVIRRHGLHAQGRETLENIGSVHSLTRERIRQIENASIKKLQKLDNLDGYIVTLKRVISELLEEHGGIMEKEYLLDILSNYSVNGVSAKEEDKVIHKNYLNFMITKLLHRDFEEVVNAKHFKDFYKLKFQDISHFEELIEELTEELKKIKKILKTEELIDFIVNKLNAYKRNQAKMTTAGNLDISRVFKFDLFEEKQEIINKHKPLYSLLRAAKKISQNKFGYWGVHNWREVRPKTINDKIYLVLKNYGKPMHFVEIAEKINAVNFDNKPANPATVHNELILDEKYVLIGRGIYGLKEWGYQAGTVSDVIAEILAEAKDLLSREEIIEKVLAKRLVKKATIILALMNKERFCKVNGKYTLKDILEKKEAGLDSNRK